MDGFIWLEQWLIHPRYVLYYCCLILHWAFGKCRARIKNDRRLTCQSQLDEQNQANPVGTMKTYKSIYIYNNWNYCSYTDWYISIIYHFYIHIHLYTISTGDFNFQLLLYIYIFKNEIGTVGLRGGADHIYYSSERCNDLLVRAGVSRNPLAPYMPSGR